VSEKFLAILRASRDYDEFFKKDVVDFL